MYIGFELDLGVSVHGVVFISLITYWAKAIGYNYLCNSYVPENINSLYLSPSQDILYPFTARTSFILLLLSTALLCLAFVMEILTLLSVRRISKQCRSCSIYTTIRTHQDNQGLPSA